MAVERVFLCHRSTDSSFVIEVARHLRPCFDDVFYYEDHQKRSRNDANGSGAFGLTNFDEEINRQLAACDALVAFVGEGFADSNWCLRELRAGIEYEKQIIVVLLPDANGEPTTIPEEVFAEARGCTRITPSPEDAPYDIAKEIVRRVQCSVGGG